MTIPQAVTLNNCPALSMENLGQFQGYLTPDALMAYCEDRMQGIDTQIQKAFAKQQSDNNDANVLAGLAQQLSLPTDPQGLDNPGGFETCAHSAAELRAAAAKVSDPATKKALNDAADQLYAKLDGALGDLVHDGKLTSWQQQYAKGDQNATPQAEGMSDKEIEDIYSNYADTGALTAEHKQVSLDDLKSMTTQAVQSAQQDLSSAAELSMIGLQSLMSQRQEAIQLCTNLVQSLGDQCNKVADNVGK